MSQSPPIELSERPGRPRVRSLGRLIALACILGTVACGNAVPTGSGTASPAAEATPEQDGTGEGQPEDVDGLVVLTGGVLAIGTSDGLLVGVDGPGGPLSAFSAANGRLVAQTAEPGFSITDVPHSGATTAWRPVEMAATEVRHSVSSPALSPGGNLLAFATADPGTTESFEVFVIDLTKRDRRSQSFDRESNGPLVWIDNTSLLVEVVPMPGGTRFLRLNIASSSVDPVHADGFGPAISGDGSLLAVASTDGSVVAVPAADWLAGDQPDEGAVVDDSGRPFALAVDRTGRRIAVGYADDGGDPTSIAVFVRDGGGWRQSTTPIMFAPGTPTMLGWIN